MTGRKRVYKRRAETSASLISTANPCEPTIVTEPTVRASTDSSTAPAMSLPEPKLRADRQGAQETSWRIASQQ